MSLSMSLKEMIFPSEFPSSPSGHQVNHRGLQALEHGIFELGRQQCAGNIQEHSPKRYCIYICNLRLQVTNEIIIIGVDSDSIMSMSRLLQSQLDLG